MRRVPRGLRIDTRPQRSPSACAEILNKKNALGREPDAFLTVRQAIGLSDTEYVESFLGVKHLLGGAP